MSTDAIQVLRWNGRYCSAWPGKESDHAGLQLEAERVRYIGVSGLPSFYPLCPTEEDEWHAATLDAHDQVMHQLGPFGNRGTAIWEAEVSIDGRTEPQRTPTRGPAAGK